MTRQPVEKRRAGRAVVVVLAVAMILRDRVIQRVRRVTT